MASARVFSDASRLSVQSRPSARPCARAMPLRAVSRSAPAYCAAPARSAESSALCAAVMASSASWRFAAAARPGSAAAATKIHAAIFMTLRLAEGGFLPAFVLASRDAPVAVLVGVDEIVGQRRIRHGLVLVDAAVAVPVQRLERRFCRPGLRRRLAVAQDHVAA